MKSVTMLLIFSMFLITTPFALAATPAISTFEVVTLANDGKKSKEVKSSLTFVDETFKSTNRKSKAIIKEFKYTDVKVADYSYSKKPLFSTTGTVVGVIFLGPLFLFTLFAKKKQHWLSVRTETDYVVMKLEKENFRQIINEFEIRQIKVATLDEDEKDKKKDK